MGPYRTLRSFGGGLAQMPPFVNHISCRPTSSEIPSAWKTSLQKKNVPSLKICTSVLYTQHVFLHHIYIIQYIYIYIFFFFFAVPFPLHKKRGQDFLGGALRFAVWSLPLEKPLGTSKPPMRISSLRMLSHKSPGKTQGGNNRLKSSKIGKEQSIIQS